MPITSADVVISWFTVFAISQTVLMFFDAILCILPLLFFSVLSFFCSFLNIFFSFLFRQILKAQCWYFYGVNGNHNIFFYLFSLSIYSYICCSLSHYTFPLSRFLPFSIRENAKFKSKRHHTCSFELIEDICHVSKNIANIVWQIRKEHVVSYRKERNIWK